MLSDDWSVAEERFMDAVEIFDTLIFAFCADFGGIGVFEVREGFI